MVVVRVVGVGAGGGEGEGGCVWWGARRILESIALMMTVGRLFGWLVVVKVVGILKGFFFFFCFRDGNSFKAWLKTGYLQ